MSTIGKIINFVKGHPIFTLSHTVVALLIAVLIRNAPDLAPGHAAVIGFFLWEMGQNKYELAGSVRDWAKQKDMLKRQFTGVKLAQWAIVAVPAYVYAFLS